MSYLIWILFGFSCFQLLNVLLNLVFIQKIKGNASPLGDLVSVMIPARNEEHNIHRILDCLQKIKESRLEILVYDDKSVDSTAEIVRQYALLDSRIRLIEGVDLPEGWLGKNHACHKLAEKAQGRYLLFLDADVAVYGNVISDAVAYLKRKQLGLLSFFPKQVEVTMGEKFTVPIMNYILLTLLPLIFVRVSPFTSHSAANGQFMLFDAKVYRRLKPHLQLKQSAVEDIAIARFLKRNWVRIACLIGDERIQCRMYSSYGDALKGFSKNIFMFFGNMPFAAFLYWGLIAMGTVVLSANSGMLLLIYLMTLLLTLLLYAVVSNQSRLVSVLLFPGHLVFMVHVMLVALKVKYKKGQVWKGRNIG